MKKVLIVDDSRLIDQVLTEYIQEVDSQIEIIVAYDGHEAIEKYKSEKPGLVLLDIKMPDEDGIQVLKDIRSFDPEAKVVMVTSMIQETYKEVSLSAGAVDFVTKPFDRATISGLLEKFLVDGTTHESNI